MTEMEIQRTIESVHRRMRSPVHEITSISEDDMKILVDALVRELCQELDKLEQRLRREMHQVANQEATLLLRRQQRR